MLIGIGLPTHLGDPPDARLVLDWARMADEAGFAVLTVHDRPDHWTWEPMTALAAAAAVTSRIRLMTSILILPARPERLVAKQAAVIDQLSHGRLDLGIGPGAREQDYAALGGSFERRGARLDRQVATLLDAWETAANTDGETSGPAPFQRPHPPLWFGGYTEVAVNRALAHGKGYLLGARGSEEIARRIVEVRAAATRAGRELPVGALAYVAFGDDARTRDEAERQLLRYYGTLHRPFADLVHVGTAASLEEQFVAYRDAGLDLLLLIPTIPELGQVEMLGSELLPRLQRGA